MSYTDQVWMLVTVVAPPVIAVNFAAAVGHAGDWKRQSESHT